MDIDSISFNERGLVPVIVQDEASGQVLMLAWANREALEKTAQTGRTHFWSRSRNKIWNKGEKSGHFQDVKEIFFDCDYDTVLVTVSQTGVACHTGEPSCFYRSQKLTGNISPTFDNGFLIKVAEAIEDRKQNPKKESYVSALLKSGLDRMLKKIGEEAGEVIIAAKNKNREELTYEIADLWFHSMVVLSQAGLGPDDVICELKKRFGKQKKDYEQKIPKQK